MIFWLWNRENQKLKPKHLLLFSLFLHKQTLLIVQHNTNTHTFILPICFKNIKNLFVWFIREIKGAIIIIGAEERIKKKTQNLSYAEKTKLLNFFKPKARSFSVFFLFLHFFNTTITLLFYIKKIFSFSVPLSFCVFLLQLDTISKMNKKK